MIHINQWVAYLPLRRGENEVFEIVLLDVFRRMGNHRGAAVGDRRPERLPVAHLEGFTSCF